MPEEQDPIQQVADRMNAAKNAAKKKAAKKRPAKKATKKATKKAPAKKAAKKAPAKKAAKKAKALEPKPRLKPEGEMRPFAFRLDDPLRERLVAYLEASGESTAGFMRRAIKRELDRDD